MQWLDSGHVYRGSWSNDQPNGAGEYTWSSAPATVPVRASSAQQPEWGRAISLSGRKTAPAPTVVNTYRGSFT